jgi:hypothetical protein
MKCSPNGLTTELELGASSIRSARLGDMIGAINTIEANLDFSPALATQPGGHCQVPHWGYVISGSLMIRFQDGTEEEVRAGDLFHMQPGHTAISGADGAVTADFSPTTPMLSFFDDVRAAVG